MENSIIDCDAGRRLGCNTFCCRLIVRFYEDERPPSEDGSTPKGCVDKAPDGLCIHLDGETHRCSIWEKRPRVCREYSCNNDYLLQVAVRVGVKTLCNCPGMPCASTSSGKTGSGFPLAAAAARMIR